GSAAVGNGTNRNGQAVLEDILVDAVVGEACKRIGDFVDLNFSFLSASFLCENENGVDNVANFAFFQERNGSGFDGFLDFGGRAHWLEKAAPIRTLRKREGEAPWPVPMVCMG